MIAVTPPESLVGEPPHVFRRPVRVPVGLLVLLLAASLAVGGLGSWAMLRNSGAPTVVQATVFGVNRDLTAVAVQIDGRTYTPGSGGESLPLVTDLLWTDADGADHGGQPPSCLLPGSSGQRIELALLELRGQGSWPRQVVVWVRCLS